MKRGVFGALLAAAALAVASFWFAAATQTYNTVLERERPMSVYDFFSYYRPNAEYAFARMRDGDLPLWNPNQGLGGPFLATLQTGVLYPPNWLHLVLPAQPAFAWLAFLHVALAAGLAGALARNAGAGPVGSVAAGVFYAMSLQIWSSTFTPPTLYTAALAPGVLLAVERAVQRPGAGRAAALAVVLGLQILVGWPYAVVMTALAAAITGGASLVRAALRTRRLPLAAIATIVLGASAGGLLAAPQLLPSLELMQQSTRAPGALDETNSGISNDMHDPAAYFRVFARQGISGGIPSLATALLAVVAIALAGRGRFRAAALFGVALFGLAMSFPNHTPIYDWAIQLPLLGDFRYPFRYRLLSSLAIAVCAGIGISRIEQRGARFGVTAAALVAAIAIALQAAPTMQAFANPKTRFPREQTQTTGALATLLTASNQLAVPLAIARRPENAAARSYWRSFGVDKLGEEEDLRTLQDLEPLSLTTTARIMTFFAKGDARAAKPAKLGAPYWGSVRVPDDASRAALLDVLSVRLLVVDEAPAWLDERYRRAPDVRRAPFAFENPHALPRAWRATRAEAEPADPQAAIARLVDPGFDLRSTVLLEPLPPDLAAPSDDTGAATELTRDEPELIEIRTRGASPALLVLNDAWYPGWQATLDGAPAPILRANTALRAVPVPAGEHVVTMRYRPRSFQLGLVLAGLAALSLVAAMIVERSRPQTSQL